MIAIMDDHVEDHFLNEAIKLDIVLLMPWREFQNVDTLFRLNSKVFLYKSKGEGAVEIFEVYAIKKGAPIVPKVGTWKGGELRIPVKSASQRRADLGGVRLLNGVLDWGLISRIPRDRTLDETDGIFPDILRYLSAKLNFTFTNVLSADGKWGGFENDGVTWNGLIRMLLNEAINML